MTITFLEQKNVTITFLEQNKNTFDKVPEYSAQKKTLFHETLRS